MTYSNSLGLAWHGMGVVWLSIMGDSLRFVDDTCMFIIWAWVYRLAACAIIDVVYVLTVPRCYCRACYVNSSQFWMLFLFYFVGIVLRRFNKLTPSRLLHFDSMHIAQQSAELNVIMGDQRGGNSLEDGTYTYFYWRRKFSSEGLMKCMHRKKDKKLIEKPSLMFIIRKLQFRLLRIPTATVLLETATKIFHTSGIPNTRNQEYNFFTT